MNKVLHLTLKKKWFDMIASGRKPEEYREIKDYWINRLCETFMAPYTIDKVEEIVNMKPYAFTYAVVRNGYGRTRPTMVWEGMEITVGNPNPDWCEPQDVGKIVFIIKPLNIKLNGNS
jgi:hypothetical protein